MVKNPVIERRDGAALVTVHVVETRPVGDDWLDDGERARADRFLRATDRATFVAAHTALRYVVGAALGRPPADVVFDVERCPVCGADDHGRPVVVDGDGVQFSLSHTTDRSIVAVAEHVVGVDVERADRRLDVADLRSTLHPDEPVPGDRRAALRHWVRKEAYLKGLGAGLGLDPSTIDLRADPPGWQIFDLDVAPDHAAVAVRSERPVRIDLRTLDLATVDGVPPPPSRRDP